MKQEKQKLSSCYKVLKVTFYQQKKKIKAENRDQVSAVLCLMCQCRRENTFSLLSYSSPCGGDVKGKTESMFVGFYTQCLY